MVIYAISLLSRQGLIDGLWSSMGKSGLLESDPQLMNARHH